MKLPYGISDFKELREQGNLYIDKTRYIEILENLNSKYVFFIRPRRFGKSLFLSTLEQYYDINAKANFDRLFEGLYIGQNPTPLKNSYLILKLNFSGLRIDNKDKLEMSFNKRLAGEVDNFMVKYKEYFTDIPLAGGLGDTSGDAGAIIKALIDTVRRCGKKMYLIIDEYDNFANDIIAVGDGTFYKDIIRASGFVREFYKIVKIGTEGVIDRIFITGASPIMLDDLTSGFNIAENVTMEEELNEMLGFTQHELDEIIDRLGLQRKEIGINLEEYYNGYLFNPDCSTRVYNPDMILYYFNKFMRTRKPPRELIDTNVKTDYGRIERLISNEKNRVILEQIIKDEYIVEDIVPEFSFDIMYDDEYFVSLLFYMGMLTIDRQEKTKLLLKIPNYIIKTLYWHYFERKLGQEYRITLDTDDLRTAIEDMAYRGNIQPYVNYISTNVLKLLSNRDLIGFDEKYIKVLLFMYLTSSRAYKLVSEREVENGYIDIYLEKDVRMPDVKYEWMIELKYVKESDKTEIETVKQQGLEQLNKYARSRGMLGRKDIKKALLVFVGKGECFIVDI